MRILKGVIIPLTVATIPAPVVLNCINTVSEKNNDFEWTPEKTVNFDLVNSSSNVSLSTSFYENVYLYNYWDVNKRHFGWTTNNGSSYYPDVYTTTCKLTTFPISGIVNNLKITCKIKDIKDALKSTDHIIKNATIDIPNITSSTGWSKTANNCVTSGSTSYKTSNFSASFNNSIGTFSDSAGASSSYYNKIDKWADCGIMGAQHHVTFEYDVPLSWNWSYTFQFLLKNIQCKATRSGNTITITAGKNPNSSIFKFAFSANSSIGGFSTYGCDNVSSHYLSETAHSCQITITDSSTSYTESRATGSHSWTDTNGGGNWNHTVTLKSTISTNKNTPTNGFNPNLNWSYSFDVTNPLIE